MENVSQSLDWLYATQNRGIKLGLENSHRLIKEIGWNKNGVPIFHVAGTNGKGSTCAFIESGLRALGIKTGLFTSPHLISYHERIRIDNVPISDEELHKGIQFLRNHCEMSPDTKWNTVPTFFELSLALALRHFKNGHVDAIILETGLGGRLDSTSAVDSTISIVTPIGLDHSYILGDTLAKIAKEKVGIFKPKTPVISAPQEKEALEVLTAEASRLGCEFEEIFEPWEPKVGIPGDHQKWNAALAAKCIEISGIASENQDLQKTLKTAFLETRWRGRFDQYNLKIGNSLVIDGAHNEMSILSLISTWKEHFGDTKATLIFGAMDDKPIDVILPLLDQIAERWLLVSPLTDRGADSGLIAKKIGSEKVEILSNTKEAWDLMNSEKTECPFLVVGSLFLAGEFLSWIDNTHKNIRVSDQ